MSRRTMGCIPRPSGGISRRIVSLEGPCLAKQMKLVSTDADVDLYYSILNTVGELCERDLPHSREVPRNADTKRLIMEEVIRRHPCLRSYEDAWPIPTMINMHRQLRKYGSQKGIMGHRMTNSQASSASGSGPRCSTSSRIGSSSRLLSRSKDRPIRRRSQRTRAEVMVPSGCRAVRNEAIQGSQGPAAYLKDFLQALPQDLTLLLPTFVQYGLVDEVSLRGMLRMQNWRSWLYSWVKEGRLTELQFAMVSEGLAKVV
ncbi:hypothetical protein BD414DRAFT_475783 [Trametes punicea]|nr:hypothetical protein BD414DRAFT_475783 [Trametes punicea]